ncbi:MAG: YjbQ family protein [Chloroflexi bacterium]|nr:YjbQ family protein [Chloroflexota bacterium]
MVVTKQISLKTKGECDIVDITALVVPFHNKKLDLGTWQQLVVVDFDHRPRSRQVWLQIMGE